MDHSIGADACQASREGGGPVDIIDESMCGIRLIKEVEVTAWRMSAKSETLQ